MRCLFPERPCLFPWQERYSDTVNMSWAQKPFWQFGGDDYDKPPIPNGTDTQYANQLLLWAQDAGYYGLTIQQCLAMLDASMYFPVTDQNQTPLLLNDRATTVRQVVEDILFVEALQERIQEQITEPLSDVSLSKAASNPWLHGHQLVRPNRNLHGSTQSK